MRHWLMCSVLLSCSLLALAACSDEDEPDVATVVATSAATQAGATSDSIDTPTPLLAVETGENTVTFGREPVSAPPLATETARLILAEGGTPDADPTEGPFDRVAFQFDGDLPGYQIQYVTGPVQGCASGQDEQIAGQAFLEVRFYPAEAHDEQGVETVSPTDIQPALPVLQQAKQTCDFEGVVTWTLGLTAGVDFRVNTLGGQILVVDMKHP